MKNGNIYDRMSIKKKFYFVEVKNGKKKTGIHTVCT